MEDSSNILIMGYDDAGNGGCDALEAREVDIMSANVPVTSGTAKLVPLMDR